MLATATTMRKVRTRSSPCAGQNPREPWRLETGKAATPKCLRAFRSILFGYPPGTARGLQRVRNLTKPSSTLARPFRYKHLETRGKTAMSRTGDGERGSK